MIKLGTKLIGTGQPCFIAAEIGINHNGDMDLALKMIEAASNCGVDAIKFQNYYTEDFILDKDLSYSYMFNGQTFIESQFEMFKRYELSFEQLKFLKDACDKRNLIFFSTPTSKRGLKDLLKLDVGLLKNGSDFLVNLPLIKQMAKSKIPTVISTGMAFMNEIDEAVRAFEEAGGTNLIILHCTSSYPTPDEDVNLLKIESLFKTFKYPVGFSDHTWGNEAAIAATAMGRCCFVEKHFTLDKDLPGPDHRFSSDPEEMKNLVNAIRKTERIMGTSKIGPTSSEKQGRIEFRLSCAAARDISVGEIIKEKDIIFIRPATGLHPRFYKLLLNKKASSNFKKGQFIHLNELN
jgi:N-acetylneuraminate synthase/N,N'-diacetyllegionaminate synthase